MPGLISLSPPFTYSAAAPEHVSAITFKMAVWAVEPQIDDLGRVTDTRAHE